MSKEKKVGVRILDAPYTIDHEYSYYTDDDGIHVGGFVLVPFGRANKKKIALVTSVDDTDDYAELKPISSRICSDLSLTMSSWGYAISCASTHFARQEMRCAVSFRLPPLTARTR